MLNGGVSVEGSTTYANVNALLGENLAFAKVGATSAIVKGDVTSISGDVTGGGAYARLHAGQRWEVHLRLRLYLPA